MEKQILQVKAFQDAFNAPSPSRPTLLPDDRAELRQNLLQEEVDEIKKGQRDQDIVQIADGVIDCMYILFGTAHEYGFADRMVMLFDEVHRSNMSKMGPDGKPIFREDGKVLKPDTYSPPKLARIMQRDFSIYKESEILKAMAEHQQKETEYLIKSKVKSKLNLIDRIRYWMWERLSANLAKKISVNFPIMSLDPVTVTIYGEVHEVE